MESALITATSGTHWDTLGHFRVLCHGVRFDHCDIQATLGHLGTLSGIIAWSPLSSLRHPSHIGTPWDTFRYYSMESALITATSGTHWDTLGHFRVLWHGVRFDHCDIRDTLGLLGTLSGIMAWSPLGSLRHPSHIGTPWDTFRYYSMESALITVTSGTHWETLGHFRVL